MALANNKGSCSSSTASRPDTVRNESFQSIVGIHCTRKSCTIRASLLSGTVPSALSMLPPLPLSRRLLPIGPKPLHLVPDVSALRFWNGAAPSDTARIGDARCENTSLASHKVPSHSSRFERRSRTFAESFRHQSASLARNCQRNGRRREVERLVIILVAFMKPFRKGSLLLLELSRAK